MVIARSAADGRTDYRARNDDDKAGAGTGSHILSPERMSGFFPKSAGTVERISVNG
jgi:hypothetical protein